MPFGTPDKSGSIEKGNVLLLQCVTWNTTPSTSLSALMGLKSVPVKIREQWMVDYLTHLSMSFDQTPYEGIYKLPPAHTLTVTPEKHHLRQYFTLSAEPELKLKDSREYVDAYREQLETAIKCRLNTTYPLGSELSGGIDSSTITAYGAKFFEQPLTNFHTFAFANSELEPQHILAVSQAYGLPYNHVFTGRRLNREGLVERSLKILGYPVEHGSATFHEPFYQLAEKYNLKQRYFDTARFDAGYTDLKRFTLEKRWMPFVPTRMENCILMAAARKIEYRWPLLDIRLVKLFLSIPSEENYYICTAGPLKESSPNLLPGKRVRIWGTSWVRTIPAVRIQYPTPTCIRRGYGEHHGSGPFRPYGYSTQHRPASGADKTD